MAHRILIPLRPLMVGFALFTLVTGCDKLSGGVVREIEFPDHIPELAVTFLARPQADSLYSRTHASSGILDSAESPRVKAAEYTLTHESGVTVNWGGQEDWISHFGHLLTDVDLAPGTWTLTVTAPGFETATAEQTFPPVIAGEGSYAYAVQSALVDSVFEAEEDWYWGNREYEISLSLPDRPDAEDHFLLRSQFGFKWSDGEDWGEGQLVSVEAVIRDDPRVEYNESLEGYLIQDVPGTEALESIPFAVVQEAWGEDIDAFFESPPVLELAALSPEMVLFYRRLDQVVDGAGGLFFSEPLLSFSNVSSGYGCFGLYTSTEVVLD